MKKGLAIAFIALILAGLTALTGVAIDTAYEAQYLDVTVMSDVHFVSQKTFTADNYAYYEGEDKMEHISEAIFNSVADEVIASAPDYLLISGDLTERGDRLSHEELAKVLKRIEAAGVNVFVINGNHDLPTNYSQLDKKIDFNEYKEIYADFGYNEAVSTFYGGLSYSADLGKTHRLIAVDNIGWCYYDTQGEIVHKPPMGESQKQWIEEQIERCKTDKRIPVIMSHIPFKDHFPKSVANMRDNDAYLTMAKYFADNGVNYAFTGHLHLQDIKKVTSDSGNEFYDIGNPSMIHYPCSYSSARLSKNGVDISEVRHDSVDEKYLCDVTPDHVREELKQGLQNYAVKHMRQEIVSAVEKLDTPSGLLGGMISKGGDRAEALKTVAKAAKITCSSPIYVKDEKDGEISMERVMKTYGVDIPSIEYKTVYEASTVYAASVFSGDDALEGKPEFDLIKYVFYYLMYNLNAASEEFAAINPSVPINVDMEKLVTTGKLECYDSGIVPFVLSLLGDGTWERMIKGMLGNDFDGIKGAEGIIAVFANGAFAGITDYFTGKEIDVDGLIYDGVFVRYAPELKSREYGRTVRLTFGK